MIHDIRGILCLQKDDEGRIWLCVSHGQQNAAINLSTTSDTARASLIFHKWAQALIDEAEGIQHPTAIEDTITRPLLPTAGEIKWEIPLYKIIREVPIEPISDFQIKNRIEMIGNGQLFPVTLEQIGFNAYRIILGHLQIAALREMGRSYVLATVEGKYSS